MFINHTRFARRVKKHTKSSHDGSVSIMRQFCSCWVVMSSKPCIMFGAGSAPNHLALLLFRSPPESTRWFRLSTAYPPSSLVVARKLGWGPVHGPQMTMTKYPAELVIALHNLPAFLVFRLVQSLIAHFLKDARWVQPMTVLLPHFAHILSHVFYFLLINSENSYEPFPNEMERVRIELSKWAPLSKRSQWICLRVNETNEIECARENNEKISLFSHFIA